MGFLDKNGNANADANAWVEGRATLNASGMNKNEQGFIGGARMTSVYNPVTGEGIADTTSVKSTKDGFDTTVNKFNPENLVEADARETAEHALDWKKSAAKIIGSGGQRQNVDTDMDGNVLMNRDSQENLKRGRKQDVGLSGYPEDVAGMAGEVAMASIAGLGAAEGLSRTFGAKDGIIKPSINKAFTSMGREPVFDIKKSSNNERTDKDYSKSSDGTKNKINDSIHSNPLDINSNTIIPKNVDGVNSRGKSHQFNPEHKTSREAFLNSNMGAHSDIKPKKMGFGGKFGALFGAMMGGATVANAYDSSASNGTNAVNVVDSLAQVLDPTMEGYNTVKKQTKAVSANISAGNYSQAAYEVMSTPMKFAQNVVNSGMDLGKSLHAAYDSHFGGYTSVVDRPSVAPQHAQNAFTQPSGFNTSSAMKTAYNDNTSNINSTPQEYQANSQDGMSRNLENINMGTEFNQESSEGVRDAVEKLSETIYKNNGGE